MSYGTPDQLSSLLASIRVTVTDEPPSMWTDTAVRSTSRELADLLYARLDERPPAAQPVPSG